jgi:hypothetical protein
MSSLLDLGDDLLGLIMDEAFGAHCLPTDFTGRTRMDADLKRFRASLRLTCKTFKTVFDSNNLILELAADHQNQYQLTVVHATPRLSSLSKKDTTNVEISALLSAMQQPSTLRTLAISGSSLRTLDLPPLLACSRLRIVEVRDSRGSL